MEKNCIFCKIVGGEVPSTKVYENEDCLAFLDVHPDSKGHTLVVPKKHFPNFLETPKDIKEKLIHTAAETAEILKKQYSPTGMNITTNIGKSAGQIILHTHIHVIPRYGKDA